MERGSKIKITADIRAAWKQEMLLLLLTTIRNQRRRARLAKGGSFNITKLEDVSENKTEASDTLTDPHAFTVRDVNS